MAYRSFGVILADIIQATKGRRIPLALHRALRYLFAKPERLSAQTTLEVITPGKEPSIVPIKVQMTSDAARSFTCSIAACDNDGGGVPEAVVIPPCGVPSDPIACDRRRANHRRSPTYR